MSEAPPRAPGELAEIEAIIRRHVWARVNGDAAQILGFGAAAAEIAALRAPQGDGAEAMRAEMPSSLNTGNLVHDVRTLRMAHDAMHQRAYRWGNAALLLLPFVDMGAGEGLEWVEQDGSPRMDAADLCFAFAEAMGCEFGDAAYTAMLKEGQDKIRTLDQHSLTKNEGGGDA